MNRSPITAQNMNGYDFRIEENYLGIIRHDPRVVNFGRSIVLRECIWSLNKNPLHIYYPCWINHFIDCVSAKYAHSHHVFITSVFQTYPLPHNIKNWFFTIKGIATYQLRACLWENHAKQSGSKVGQSFSKFVGR